MPDLTERIGVEIFRFNATGETLVGILTEIDTIDISGRPTIRYTFQDTEQSRWYSLLGTVDLNKKIRKSDIGKLLEVRFDGLDTRAGKYPIKRFRVFGQQ